MIIKFNSYNESLRDKLKGKSDIEISNNINADNVKKYFNNSCRYGIVSIVKKLLKDDRIDPTYSDNYPIQISSQNGHTDVVRELLKDDRVDPSANGNYAMQSAADKGHVEVVKLLLKDERVDPTVRENFPVKFACVHGHLDVVKELLKDERVDPSETAREDSDNFAIEYAFDYGHFEVVKELLKDKRITDKLSTSQLKKYKEQVEKLTESLKTKKGSIIKRYKEVGKKMGNDLYFHKNYISEYINPEYYNKLLTYLPDNVKFNIIKYNDKDNYISFIYSPDFDTADEPIVSDAYKVTEEGRVTLTREKTIPQIYHHKWLFVKDDYKGFDIEKSIRRSEKWLEYSDQFNMSKIGFKKYWEDEAIPLFESLRDKLKGKPEQDILDITKNFSKEKQLEYGLKYDIPYLVEKSLKDGAKHYDIDSSGYHGYYDSLVYKCVEKNRLDIIKILFNYIYTSDKERIMGYACELNKLNIVKFVVENGVKVNNENKIFLYDTVKKGNTEIVKYLIEQGIDIHRETLLGDRGERFLEMAVKNQYYDIVKLLLDNGANPLYDKGKIIKMASELKSDVSHKINKILKEYAMKKTIKKVKNFIGFKTNESIWEKPKQELSSAKTSIRQIPKPAKILINSNELQPNTINLDIGGGIFENMTEFLSKFGVTSYVYDPFNRSKEHNEMVLEKTKDGQSDSVTIFNVLNVIKERENQIKVLEQAKNAVKNGGKIYIYSNYYVKGEGARKIKGRDSFQQNYKLNDILPIIKEVFPNAYLDRKLMCVVATK